MSARRFERLVTVTWERREWHPVGETRDEMAACMAWVISLGHEAKSLEDGGFRYRSVYPATDEGPATSCWKWAEPGEWLMHMHGERQDPELDDPHAAGPDGDEYVYGFQPDDGWHEVPASEVKG